jgi:hypothetical protein
MERHRRDRRAAGVGAAVVLAVLTGCAGLGPDPAAASRAAERFHAAVADEDGETACALLAPAVVEELESAAGEPCADAVLAEDLPGASGVQTSHAYGRQAQVVMRGDVVFLTVSGAGWLVTAAGCTPRPERPYDCTVSGG